MFTKLKISNDEKKQQRINKWRKHTLIYYILYILFICNLFLYAFLQNAAKHIITKINLNDE